MAEKPKTIVKVAKYRILKPAGDMTWSELGQMLRDVRYRVYRLANLAASEAYLNFQIKRQDRTSEYKIAKIGELSERLSDMLKQEGFDDKEIKKFSRKGALPAYVYSPLHMYKIRAIKWKEVLSGRCSLPTFRNNISIPIRCDQPIHRRLEMADSGNVEVDLMICRVPYPRVVLATAALDDSQKSILNRLLDNKNNTEGGYRQRIFEIKQDTRTKKWFLLVTYDFPSQAKVGLNKDIVVGVDIGFSLPLYAAINNGYARLGRRQFGAIGRRVQALRRQLMARRREIQRGGSTIISKDTARSGHGRKRKLLPIEKLQKRVENSYTTLNHQLSNAVIDFVKNHGAGTIQIEDTTGLKEQLIGTFLGANWRYHQLQQYLEYKAKEAGIILKRVNPRYTSRRCSECGFINIEFDRQYRDTSGTKGKVAKFICPDCGYEADPDYNAARNISTLDIEKLIRLQCKKQELAYEAL